MLSTVSRQLIYAIYNVNTKTIFNLMKMKNVSTMVVQLHMHWIATLAFASRTSKFIMNLKIEFSSQRTKRTRAERDLQKFWRIHFKHWNVRTVTTFNNKIWSFLYQTRKLFRQIENFNSNEINVWVEERRM